MAYELSKFGSGPMDKGVAPRTMDFSTDVELATQTLNMSQGMEQGLTVRHGTSPIPGHNDNETATLNPRLPGLMMSEGAPSIGLTARKKVLGWVQLSLPDPSNVKKNINVYGAVITDTFGGSEEYLDVMLCSVAGVQVENISSNIYDGFGVKSPTVVTIAPNNSSFLAEGIVTNSGSKAATILSYLNYDTTIFFASIATINVTGADIAMNYALGKVTNVGSAVRAPSSNFFLAQAKSPNDGTTDVNIICGVPSEYNLENYKIAARSIRVIGLTNKGALSTESTVNVTPSTSTFKPDRLETGVVNLDLSAVAAVTTGVTYSSNVLSLVIDPASSSNSSYTAIAVASSKPYLCLMQAPYRCNRGPFNQWFDLTQNVWQPPTINTDYTEDGAIKSTSFVWWPSFATGFPMSNTSTAGGPNLGAADTGVLRKNTVYELTYSLYNKRLNFETNVGVPVKIQTDDTDDFTSIEFWNADDDPGNLHQSQFYVWQLGAPAIADQHIMPFPNGFQDADTGWWPPGLAINFIEYRFYYRELGTFEWLPAANIDASRFWFDPYLHFNLCTGAVAATPGGQPGAFNDYSPLPTDNYNCVVQFKNRLFWFSEKACVFSLSNNVFAYAGRNSISASTGEFRGAIVHNYPGQAEQSSRLVIFGTKEIYVARFTGAFQQTQVQVSADTSATFNIEGSDLVIDPWTSVTAFTYRAAVIAEGILFYWGPQGVYRDDGVGTPTKVSVDIEPYIFTIYDPSFINEIHGVYDDLTKEITWFYHPKNPVGTQTTASLIYCIKTESFLLGTPAGRIDWVQNLNIATNMPTAGKRTIAGIRKDEAATVQRAYFYDNRNRSGDMYPTTDWMVKQISTPSTGVRRLTLAAGYDATNFATIAVGDYIALQQTKAYYDGLDVAEDMVAVVSAINTGAGTVDITLPTGALIDESGSAAFRRYFPFWQRTPTGNGLNGIPYNLQTTYWTPSGIGGYFFWLYWYLIAKLTQWKTDLSLGWTLGYRSPTSLDFITDDVTFEDNSDGNFQLYHPLRLGDDNAEGQGLKLRVSGSHIGPEWVIQYMEIHGTTIAGDVLKRFEG